jgi:Spy/CpxP family protein refolding chaperone
MMRTLRSVSIPVLLALAPLSSLACGGSVSEQPAATQAGVSKAPVAVNAHGPVKMFGQALGEVALRDDQRAQIEQLASAAETRHEATRQARADLMNTLAAQIEAGAIDRTALQPKIDAIVASVEQARPADRAALEQLHSILAADQRVDFVNALEAEMQAKTGEHMGGRQHMKEWADALQLTDAQKDQIKTALKAKWEATREQMHAQGGAKAEFTEGKEHAQKIFEAFKADRFVMDEVAPPQDAKAHATRMTEHMLGVAETVLPILTPQQRTLAAQKLRSEAQSTEMPGL